MAEVLVLVEHAAGHVKKVTGELLTLAARIGQPAAVGQLIANARFDNRRRAKDASTSHLRKRYDRAKARASNVRLRATHCDRPASRLSQFGSGGSEPT